MKVLWYGVVALLVLALGVTSIGWYLSAHPGGTRFASCRWEGNQLVLQYSYGTGDEVTTLVKPSSDKVIAQVRVDERGGDTSGALTGEARFALAGGPRPVQYPNGAELNCPSG
jgi:hypothetical protein